VTVPTIDTIARDVTFVAELNGLLARHMFLRHPGRTIDLIQESDEGRDEEESSEDTDARDGIRTAMKNLHTDATIGSITHG
jgi:hypothetical protein